MKRGRGLAQEKNCSFNPENFLHRKKHLHFSLEQTEAQKSEVTCKASCRLETESSCRSAPEVRACRRAAGLPSFLGLAADTGDRVALLGAPCALRGALQKPAAVTTPNLAVAAQSVSRHCQMALGDKVTLVEN